MDWTQTHVRIDERLLHRINVREWGLPTLRMPGKIWRSEKNGTMHCMVAADKEEILRIESLPLVVVPAGDSQWIPPSWSAAIWEYVQAWPSSGCGYGPFLRVSEAERNALLRKLGANLVTSDEIGCVSIADSIGMLAAFGYERMEDAPRFVSTPTQ